ncbi:hypothetical protein B0H19DRAFT_1075682 [Mycena capillaripes]|nr:hypothetical protein B0H19DRAFT_1075682 [Mycena capillaripes]
MQPLHVEDSFSQLARGGDGSQVLGAFIANKFGRLLLDTRREMVGSNNSEKPISQEEGREEGDNKDYLVHLDADVEASVRGNFHSLLGIHSSAVFFVPFFRTKSSGCSTTKRKSTELRPRILRGFLCAFIRNKALGRHNTVAQHSATIATIQNNTSETLESRAIAWPGCFWHLGVPNIIILYIPSDKDKE